MDKSKNELNQIFLLRFFSNLSENHLEQVYINKKHHYDSDYLEK